MAMLKLQAPALKQAIGQQADKWLLKLQMPALKQTIDQQANGYIKTISACTEAGYRPAGRQMAVLKLQVLALKQTIDEQADKWLC